MRKTYAFLLACLTLMACLGTVAAQAETSQDVLRRLLNNIDSSVLAIRKGDTNGALGLLGQAFSGYDNLTKANENKFDNDLRILDNYIRENLFVQSPTEGNIFTLRDEIVLLAGKLGVHLPLIYEWAIFIILGLAVLFSLVITLITKKVVDWNRVKQIKAEVDSWRKDLLDAQRKKDMKRIYKLKQDQGRIMGLQSQLMMSSLKPAIFYIVPYFIFWRWLGSVYGGWVVAFLPFSLPLPIGLWASCGFFSWFLISYFGFSSIWRKLLIGD